MLDFLLIFFSIFWKIPITYGSCTVRESSEDRNQAIWKHGENSIWLVINHKVTKYTQRQKLSTTCIFAETIFNCEEILLNMENL